MARSLRVLRFGVFEIYVEARELRRRGYLTPLPPQPFAVLAALAGSGGRMVSREELCALLWPDDVHLDRDRGLNHCLARIRQVLGDDARAPRFVETVPRLGYRFLASVETVVIDVDSTSSAPRPALPPSKRPRAVPWLALVAAPCARAAPRRCGAVPRASAVRGSSQPDRAGRLRGGTPASRPGTPRLAAEPCALPRGRAPGRRLRAGALRPGRGLPPSRRAGHAAGRRGVRRRAPRRRGGAGDPAGRRASGAARGALPQP